MRLSRLICCLVALASAGALQAGPAPARVVSVNLCTDQLALLLAAPGQLISVSRLARNPDSSALHARAAGLPVNGSGAEEVYLLKPDLVLAGTFTAASTVDMLRALGIRVELFAPASSLDDVTAQLAQMGAVLGREAAAEAMVDAFREELAALDPGTGPRPRAALFYVNSYSSGDKTLAGDILRAAGFDNVATEAGLDHGGTLPLEQLVMLAPDVIVRGRNYPGQARAEDNLDHPALSALPGTVVAGELTDRDWICGTPQVLNAVRAMHALRQRIGARE